MPQFTHFVLTRYNLGLYDKSPEESESWMRHRFVYFQKCRESVLSQGVDFRWIIFFDSRTPWNWIAQICTDPRIEAVTDCQPLQYPLSDKCDTDWIITTRLDNDDKYLPGALQTIQAAFKPMVMCIDIDYYGYNGLHYHTSNRGSATSFFISLVEPRESARSVFYTQHNKVRSLYPIDGELTRIPEVMIKRPLAVMNVHGWNLANKIEGHRVDINKI